MGPRFAKGWVFTFGLAALVVAAGLVARTTAPIRASGLDHAERDRCIEYGPIECCIRTDEVD